MRGLRPSRSRRAAADALGTGFPVAAVVGSGTVAERMMGGNPGLALLANPAATGIVVQGAGGVAAVGWMAALWPRR